MRVLHVIGGLNPESGGPSRSVPGLCKALAEAGAETALFVHEETGSRRVCLGACRLFKGRGFGLKNAHGDFCAVLDEWQPDIVHLHGIWDLTCHIDTSICRKRGISYVIAPRGSLDAWCLNQKKWKKRLALWLYQRRDLQKAIAIHTTSDAETEYVRAQGCRQTVIQSPNGVNLPSFLPPAEKAANRFRALFLSRMNRKKGVLDLVGAWGNVRPKNWICELVYTIGNDEDKRYETQVKSLVDKLGLNDAFAFTGSMSDSDKWKAYRRADAFVLPTYAENFGIVIAEALYAGLPVLTTKRAPWKGLVDNECGWWVDVGASHLENALREMSSLDKNELKRMGERGRKFVLREFDWQEIAGKMIREYNRLLKETPVKRIVDKPQCKLDIE